VRDKFAPRGPLLLALACVAVAAAVLLWRPGRERRATADRLNAERASGEQPSWNRVVAGLQQLAEEYPEALEFPERTQERLPQLAEFSAKLSAQARQLRASPADAQIEQRIDALRPRLLTVEYELGRECRAAADLIVARKSLPRTPRHTPDLEHGKRVFAQACAACHGADGAGDSPIAAGLDPPPPNILHPQYNWTPYEMFNRLTWGGIETAMPAFDEGLSPEERWDVVFWLFAERWPPCAKELPPLAADELALLGDFELGNRFGYGAASCLRRHFLPPR
jgi:high-affinity iron transporter